MPSMNCEARKSKGWGSKREHEGARRGGGAEKRGEGRTALRWRQRWGCWAGSSLGTHLLAEGDLSLTNRVRHLLVFMRLAIDPLVVIVRNGAREVFAAVTEHHCEHDEGGDRGAKDPEVLPEVEEAGVGTARGERAAAADAKLLELGLAHRGRGQGEDEEDLGGDLAEQVKGAGVRGRWRESARCEQLGSGALRAAVGRTRTITYPLALALSLAVSCPMPAFLQPKKKTPMMMKAIQNVPASAPGPGGSESAVHFAVCLERVLAPPRGVARAGAGRGGGRGHGGGGGGWG